MTRNASNDIEYLATRLHARRSRLAENGRLGDLCQVHSLADLNQTLFPGVKFATTVDMQRRLVQDLINEISRTLNHLDDSGRELILWLLARFQWENVKLLLRGFLSQTPGKIVQSHLVALPGDLALDVPALLQAKSVEEFTRRLPTGDPRNCLEAAIVGGREPPRAFILEGALDCGYFQGLIRRGSWLPGGEDEIVKPLIMQEANLFQFLAVARGRFHFGLAPDVLKPLCLGAKHAEDSWFDRLLAAPDLSAMAKLGLGIAIDAPPSAVEIPMIEALGWRRYLRLANSVFRRSHMGVAAVAGYFGVRRIEIANLISLSEGMRLGLGENELQARMIPPVEREAAHA